MKRFLVVFLILAVAGGGLFAQALTFSGLVWSGVGILLNDHEDFEDPYFGVYSGRENAAARADLTTNFVTEDGDAGFRFLLRGQAQRHRNDMQTGANTFNDNGVWIVWYEAWLRFFGGMVEVRGGRLDSNGLFNPDGGVEAHMDNAGGAGVAVTVSPPQLPGFHARASVFPANNLFNGDTFEDARYNIGLRYELPGTANIIFNLRQGVGGRGTDAADQTDIGFGVHVLALRDLGFTRLNVDFAFLNLQAPENTNTLFQFGPRVDFVMGDIQAGTRIILQHALDGEDNDGYQPDFTFTAYARYLLFDGFIVPQLNFGINSGTPLRNVRSSIPRATGETYGLPGFGNPNDDFRANWDGVARGDWFAGQQRGFRQNAGNMAFGPSVQFRIGGRDSRALELGYSLQADLSDYEGSTDHLKTMNHLIYLDIRVAF